jgi:hypothetical protein
MNEKKKYRWIGASLPVLGRIRVPGAYYEFTEDEAQSLIDQGFLQPAEEDKPAAKPVEEPAEKPAKTVKTATRKGRRNG